MFTPETVDLPDAWPACRRPECRSTAATARVDEPYGPVVTACENGHFRAYRKKADFRTGARYGRLFSERAVTGDPTASERERVFEPADRRRAEILEDAERCALCGTPPAEHPYRPDLDVRADRDVWAWLQRWRPELDLQLREAVAIAGRRERLTAANWRSRIAPRLREILVRALADSALETHHLVPVERLAPFADAMPARELAFAVNRLLLAMCRTCADARRFEYPSRDEYLRDYVRAFHDGDERLARADASAWRIMESIAARGASVRRSAGARSAS